jgi:hypothetical protein
MPRVVEIIGVSVSRRRLLLLGTVALVSAACAPSSPSPTQTTVALPPDFDGWRQEAEGMLSDVLKSLRTFDDFQAFRVTTAESSGMKLASELMWDPPTSAAWDEATHVTRGLAGRAEQLFQAVTTAQLDPSLWRQQRDIADATHAFLDLGDALVAYRDRVDVVPPGDASTALALLDASWAQWSTVAARWGTSRAEPILCAA